jgi:predicted nucleic acid-binding protein
MVVIDASVLVDGLLIVGAARARLASDNLQAPELIDVELLSVLRRLVLADQLQEGHALQALATANRLGLRRHPSRSLWPRAWELRTNLSAHDALYVALAEQLDAPLLTADARLARAPGLRCPIEVLEP